MSRTRRVITVALCAAVVGCVIIPAFIQGETPPAPATQAATAPRGMDELSAELKAAGEAFHDIVPAVKMLGNPAFRKDNAAKAIPAAKKVAAILNEIATAHPEVDGAMDGRYRYLGSAVALGDKEAADILTTASTAKNPDEALSAKSYLIFGQWVAASEDPIAQAKILDDYTEIAKAKPKEDQIAFTLKVMSQLGAANAELSNKAVAVIQNTLTGDAAQEIAMQLAELDKPIVIVGRTTANTKFTSASMKGKVILVDFWATWCGPCKEALPEVKKLYADYHAKGLEIVGVDCDGADDVVNDFIKENEMAWPQLREASQSDDDNWHPLAKKYGVNGIPTMFIIDKKGILRDVDAADDLEEKVKKLLAEPDAQPPKDAAPKPK